MDQLPIERHEERARIVKAGSRRTYHPSGMTGGGMLSKLVLVVDLNPNEHLKENV
jgi:hypothetical protein